MDLDSLMSASKQCLDSQKHFPVINGKVVCDLDGYEDAHFELSVIDGLFIKDAMKNQYGENTFSLLGQKQEYLVKGIFKEVHTDVMHEARYLTCVYLEQIEKAAEESQGRNVFVETVFGLKYLDWVKPKKEIFKAKRDFSVYRH